jgi:hypothetical protein
LSTGSGSSARTQRRAGHQRGGSIDPCRGAAAPRWIASTNLLFWKLSAQGRTHSALADCGPCSHAPAMFVVSETEAAAIRAAFEQSGELAAAVELRRLFPGVTDNMQARECARAIAGWEPLPPRLYRRREP